MDSIDGDLPNKMKEPDYRRSDINGIRVRKAEKSDVEGIFKVAASVGTKDNDSYKGFLMDDYQSDPKRFKRLFGRMVDELEYFYVVRAPETVGFLMAFTKEQWLSEHPNWIDDVHWSPEFEMSRIGNFVMVDKIAIMKGFSGKGVGSRLYRRFIKDLKAAGVEGILSETIIYPTPNFASLSFRKKQKHMLAGIRYEEFNGKILADGIYYKPVK
ncbi:MAG: GNAT family N-acetyltransferase [Peptostreptococcaceae bacterium]|nr:GNAT family N-acetyltransferase [Peptostreptococcaceae bacterium]